jgi:hypothetical protein
LKEKLKRSLILIYPDFNKFFIICYNTSDFRLRAILQQLHEKKQEKVVQYASRTMKKQERNYSTTKKEELAII